MPVTDVPAPAPRTTPAAMLLRAVPRLVFLALVAVMAVTQTGWLQLFAVIVLLVTSFGSAEWLRYVRTGVKPADVPGKPAPIPPQYRGDLELWLETTGEKKIQVVKLVREVSGFSFNETKRVVENPPVRLVAGLNADGGALAVKRFEDQGATVSLREPAR